MKKLLSICLAVLVVVGLMPVYALADDGGDEPYVVSYNATPEGGTVSVSGVTTNEEGKTVATGTSITVTATADEGYELKELTAKTGDGPALSIVSGIAFTISGNVSIHAAFEKPTTPEPTTPEPTTPEPTTSTPTPTTPTTSGSNGLTGTNDGTAPTADPVVTVASAENGTLSVSYSGGTITEGNNASVASSTKITVTAAPDEHYKLKSITLSSGENITDAKEFTVNGDVTVSAEFELITYAVNYTITGADGKLVINGSEKTASGNVSANEGTQLTVNAVPEANYKVKSFSVTMDGQSGEQGGNGNNRTISNVTGIVTISVEFEADSPAPVVTHAVKWKTDSNGSIKVTVNGTEIKSGDQVAKDAKFTVTATPDNGYVLDKLTVTGATQDGDTSTYTVGTSDVDISATFKYNGGTSAPSYVYRPIGVYDDDGDWLEDNSGSSFPRPSSDGKVVLDGVLPNQTFYIKLGDAGNDYVTELSGGGKARASQLVDDNLFKISVDKDGDGKSLISKIEQVEEKRLGGMTRASYLKVTLKDMTSTDERKANAEIEFKAKKDKDGSWKKGETAILNLNMWISNKKVSGSDGDADTGEKIYFSPEANENNVLIWGDDRAALEFTADDDAKDFYARLSTKSMSDIYSEYGDPVDADLWFYDFVGNPSIPSTSRAYLTLGIPWDDDDDYTPNPHDVYIYRLDKDGYLEDVTAMFTYSEDDREIEGWTTRTRTLGTYIVSDTELDIDSYYDDDDDTEVPSIDVSNNQKPVPNTGR